MADNEDKFGTVKFFKPWNPAPAKEAPQAEKAKAEGKRRNSRRGEGRRGGGQRAARGRQSRRQPSSPTILEQMAAEVCKRFVPSAEAKKLLQGNLTLLPAVQALVGQQLFPDALGIAGACLAEAGSDLVGVPVRPASGGGAADGTGRGRRLECCREVGARRQRGQSPGRPWSRRRRRN